MLAMLAVDGVADLASVHGRNAPDINRSSFQRSCEFHSGGVGAWIDVGAQVLRHVRWAPECAAAAVFDVQRKLPPFEDGQFSAVKPRGNYRPLRGPKDEKG